MKTEPTVELSIIEWDTKFRLLYTDIDEREEVYEARGEDFKGCEYSGIATFSCDELVDITDVEII